MATTMTPQPKAHQWTLGDRIAKARREADMTTDDLGDAIYCSRQSVTNWERGHNKPSFRKVAAIAAATNTDLAWLAGDDYSSDTRNLSALMWAGQLEPGTGN